MTQEITPNYVSGAIKSIVDNGEMTPFLVIDEVEVVSKCNALLSEMREYFPLSHAYYSYKTNSTYHITETLASLGFGAEVASAHELKCALDDGTANNGVLFDGPLKTENELKTAIELCSNLIIHLDNLTEAKMAICLMGEYGSKYPVRFGVRLAHKCKSKRSRFGFTSEELSQLQSLSGYSLLNISGIHIHTGTNLSSINTFIATFEHYQSFIGAILNKKDSWIDIGGGFPANTKKHYNQYTFPQMVADYYQFLRTRVNLHKVRVLIEPGRYVCEDSGYLVSRVSHYKQRKTTNIAICDAGLNYLSSIKSCVHNVEYLYASQEKKVVDLYGSNCFESDLILKNVSIPFAGNQHIIIRGCGGYDIPSTYFWLRSPYPVFSITNRRENDFGIVKYHIYR